MAEKGDFKRAYAVASAFVKDGDEQTVQISIYRTSVVDWPSDFEVDYFTGNFERGAFKTASKSFGHTRVTLFSGDI